MIQVEVRRTGAAVTGIAVKGHAGLGKPGTDILCAAVSVLAENLGAGLRVILNLPLSEEKEDGYYLVEIPAEQADESSDLLFASALLGLKALEQAHPDRVTLKE